MTQERFIDYSIDRYPELVKLRRCSGLVFSHLICSRRVGSPGTLELVAVPDASNWPDADVRERIEVISTRQRYDQKNAPYSDRR
jgi:hypothetical protein